MQCTFFTNGVMMPEVGTVVYQLEKGKLEKLKVSKTTNKDIVTIHQESIKDISKEITSRDEIFITLEVSDDGYLETKKFIIDTMYKLKTNYLNLVLLNKHSSSKITESWKALEDLYAEGVIKTIGVKDFNDKELINMYDNVRIKPMINQIKRNYIIIK